MSYLSPTSPMRDSWRHSYSPASPRQDYYSNELHTEGNRAAPSHFSTSYAKTADQLRAEITSLRSQIDQTHTSHQRELHNLKADQDERLRKAQEDGRQKQHTLQNRIRELEHQLLLERDKERDLNLQIDQHKREHNDEITRLQTRLRSLTEEIESTKARNSQEHRSEMSRLQQEKEQLDRQHTIELENMRKGHEEKVAQLKGRLNSQEEMIGQLEIEAQNLRRQLGSKAEANRKDTLALQDTLESTRRVLELQEQDLTRLRSSRDDALKENEALQQELNHLHSEIRRIKRENLQMKQDTPQLERRLKRGAK